MNNEKMIDRCGGSRQQFYFTLKGGIRAVEKGTVTFTGRDNKEHSYNYQLLNVLLDDDINCMTIYLKAEPEIEFKAGEYGEFTVFMSQDIDRSYKGSYVQLKVIQFTQKQKPADWVDTFGQTEDE